MIDRNGQGIIFGGGADRASSDTIIRNNLITNSKLRDNVESHYNAGEPAGRNNVVTNNCISGGAYDDGDGGILQNAKGFTAVSNLLVDPGYTNPAAGDYTLKPGSPCAALFGSAEEPPAEDPPAEEPPAEDPPVEEPPAEDPPAEEPPAEDPPVEDLPAVEPPVTEPPVTDPPVTDPPVTTARHRPARHRPLALPQAKEARRQEGQGSPTARRGCRCDLGRHPAQEGERLGRGLLGRRGVRQVRNRGLSGQGRPQDLQGRRVRHRDRSGPGQGPSPPMKLATRSVSASMV